MNTIGEILKTNDRLQNIVLQGFDPVSAGGFTQVPNCLLRNKDLSFSAKIVYSQLLSYAWTNGFCYPGQVRMADDIGSTKSTVNRAILELQEKGWLAVNKRGQGKTNIYTLRYRVNHARIVDKSKRKRD